MRPSGRDHAELRPISIQRHFTKHAPGSVLICAGDTQVICTASVAQGVPHFLRNSGQGWLTAEYGMLPGATHERTQREAARGKQTGRTQEISRLIGRSLRAALDLKRLGEYTVTLDCDVIQADGGTRTASITGAYVALHDAITHMLSRKQITQTPLHTQIAAVSVGMVNGEPCLDLDYAEDSKAQTDMNVVMNAAGDFIELQGTAEQGAFSPQHLLAMSQLAQAGIQSLLEAQNLALAK